MFISKRIPFDCNATWGSPLRTTGIYGHLPKFRNKPFHYSEHYSDIYTDEERASLNAREIERYSKWYQFSISYPGYLRYVGRNKMWTLWYMGNPYRPGKIVECTTIK